MSSETVLCNVDDVKAFTQVSTGFIEFNQSIESFIVMASAQVRTFTRSGFDVDTYIETFLTRDNDQGDPLEVRLSNTPIDKTTPLEVKYSPNGRYTGSYYDNIADAYYELDFVTGKLVIDFPMSFCRNGLQVKYKGGYAVETEGTLRVVDVPNEIRVATAMQAAHLFSKSKDKGMGKTSIQSNADVQTSYDRGGITGLIREVQGMLLHKRRTLVGRT